MTLAQIRQYFNRYYSSTLTPAQIDNAVNWFGQLHNDGGERNVAARGAIALTKTEAKLPLSQLETEVLTNPVVKRYAP